jgi:hypothetical protein
LGGGVLEFGDGNKNESEKKREKEVEKIEKKKRKKPRRGHRVRSPCLLETDSP